MTPISTTLWESRLRLQGYRQLTPRVPLRPGEAKRQIWAAPAVYELLKGEKPDSGFPDLEADGFIGTFSKGYLVDASRRPKSKARFKWLCGVEQVWVLSFRKPPPGWRILGRFAQKNMFIAMAVFEREQLDDMVTYTARAKDMIVQWEELFPGVDPHSGSSFGDFLGEMHRNDDEQL